MTRSVEAELGRNARSLRRLAAALVGEQHADDLVQETALAVLRHERERDGPPRSLRAWLHRVVRHLAGKERRARRRWQHHAPQLPGAEPDPTPALAAEQREILQRLHAALLQLPEPYQSTLVLRFHGDLRPAAIAARTGVPLATVKSRLQRGLLLLRERLDADGRGDWRPAMVAFGAPRLIPAAAAAALLSGALLMTTTTKLTLAAAALVAAALWIVLPRTPEPPPALANAPSPPHAGLGAATGAGPAPDPGPAAAAAASDDGGARVAAAPAASVTTGSLLLTVLWGDDKAPAAGIDVGVLRRGESSFGDATRATTDAAGLARFDGLPHGRVTTFARRGDEHFGPRVELVAGEETKATLELPLGLGATGRVVDSSGAPVADADVVVAPWGGGGTQVLGRSAPDGTFALRAIATSCHVGARKRGYRPSSMRQFATEDGARVEFTIVLDGPGGTVRGTVLDPHGKPVANALVRAGSMEQDNHRLPDGGSAMAPQSELQRTDEHGRFEFASVVPGRLPLAVRAAGFAAWAEDVEVAAGRPTDVAVHLLPGVVLLGTVRDATGTPIEGASIRVGDWRELGARSVESAADGSFRLGELPVGERQAEVRHETKGSTTASFVFVAGEERRWDPVLDQGLVLRGRVVGHDGNPPPHARVEASLDPPQPGDRWFGHTRTDAEGRFALANCLPGRSLRLAVHTRAMFPVLVQRGVVPRGDEVVLRLPEEAFVRIEGTALGPAGAVLPGVQISTGMEGSFSGTPVDAVDPGTGDFALGPFPPGTFTVRLSADGYPTIRLQRTLAPDETWRVGTVRFEPGGTLAVQLVGEAAAAAAGRAWIVPAGGTETVAWFEIESGAGRSEPLATGDYELVLGRGIPAQVVPFTIRPSAETRLDLQAGSGTAVEVVCDAPPTTTPSGTPAAAAPTSAPTQAAPPSRLPLVVRDGAGRVAWRGTMWRRGEGFAVTLTLAPGRYELVAEHGGRTAGGAVEVGSTPATTTLTFAPR